MSQVIDSATRALSQTGTQVQKLLIGLPAAVEGLLADIQTNANTIADQEATITENASEKYIDLQRAEAEMIKSQALLTAAQKGTLNTMVIVPEKFSALGAVK